MSDITINNENCFDTMSKMDADSVNVIITSPPYNNGRGMGDSGSFYDEFSDDMDEKEYREFTIKLFKEFDRIIVPNGIILYNIGYHAHNPSLPYKIMADILEQTQWTISDTIIWKKKSATPNNVDPCKLTRIWEFVWVFCRKSETLTYSSNRKISGISPVGQTYYHSVLNLIEADNNDEPTPDINQATYSTDLIMQLLDIYVKHEDTIYDPFMGTGTTAVACKKYGVSKCIGSELSAKQCEYAQNRINKCSKNKKQSQLTEW